MEEVITAAVKQPNETISAAVERVLQNASEPLSVEDICWKVYGRTGSRERATVHQNLHRLYEKDKITKLPMRYVWKEEIPFG